MSLHLRTGRVFMIGIGIMLLIALFLSGCEKSKETSSTSGTGSSAIYLSVPNVTPDSVAQGGTTIFEIVVVDDDDNPVEGVTVTFGVQPSNAGSFVPAYDISDTNGLVTAVFTPSRTGEIGLFGYSSGVYSAPVSLEVTTTGQPSTGNLSVDIDPNVMVANGTDTAVVTITVTDGTDPAPESTRVWLTAGEEFYDKDNDGHFTSGIDSLLGDINDNDQWDAIGSIPPFAYTDDEGIATVIYTAGTVATTSYIKATVTGTGDYDGSIQTSVTLTSNAVLQAIEVSADDPGIQVQGTGGIEMTNLRATCYDINGSTLPAGQKLTFYITSGPGGGESIGTLGLDSANAITDGNGRATVPIWSGTRSGTVRVRALSGAVVSNATFVTIHAGPPYYISVGAEDCNIQGWHVVNEINEITALVTDEYKNPVQEGVEVYFTTDEGAVDARAATVSTTGIASTTFRAGAPWGDGKVWLYAETSGGTVKDSTMFYNTDVTSVINIYLSPGHLMADGRSKAALDAILLDLNGNPVLNGTQPETRADYGNATIDGSEDGCHYSVASGEYTAPTLEADYSMSGGTDNGIGAIDHISVWVGAASSQAVCTLLTEYAYHDKSSVALENAIIPYSTPSVPLLVVIKDRYGNPLGDHTLTAIISNGTMVVGTDKTDRYGEANAFRFNAPDAPPADSSGVVPNTTALIVVTDTDARGGIVLSTKVTFSTSD